MDSAMELEEDRLENEVMKGRVSDLELGNIHVLVPALCFLDAIWARNVVVTSAVNWRSGVSWTRATSFSPFETCTINYFFLPHLLMPRLRRQLHQKADCVF